MFDAAKFIVILRQSFDICQKNKNNPEKRRVKYLLSWLELNKLKRLLFLLHCKKHLFFKTNNEKVIHENNRKHQKNQFVYIQS